MNTDNNSKTKADETIQEISDTELINVAGGTESAVNSAAEILRPLKEKVINEANDTNTDVDRAAIQKEIDASVQQIDDNALLTFNGNYINAGK